MGQVCHIKKCNENIADPSIHALSEIKSEKLIEGNKQVLNQQSPCKPQGISSYPQQRYQTEDEEFDLNDLNSNDCYTLKISNEFHKKSKKSGMLFTAIVNKQSLNEPQQLNLKVFDIPRQQRKLIPSERQIRKEMYEQRRKHQFQNTSPMKIKKVIFSDQRISTLCPIFQESFSSPKKKKSELLRNYGSCKQIQSKKNYANIVEHNSQSPNGILKKSVRSNSNLGSNASARKKKVHFSGFFTNH